MCEVCAYDVNSACEVRARGAWFRCVVGCWVASDMVACGGQTWIWLLVELNEKKTKKQKQNYINLHFITSSYFTQ